MSKISLPNQANTVTLAELNILISDDDMVGLANIQSITGIKTFNTSTVKIKGSSTGVTTLANANASATDYILTLPATTGTVALIDVVGVWTKSQSMSVVTLTSTSTSIAIDLSLSNNFSHTLTESTTLANPSNIVAGQSGQITFTQHASAAKTLAFGGYWKSADGAAVTLSTTVGAINLLSYYVNNATHITFNLVKHGVA